MVQKYQALVYTVCHQLVPDVQEAQDLTQETFLAAWRAIDRCPPGFEKQWLARIAANKAKDYLRSAWVRKMNTPGDEVLALEGAPPGMQPEQQVLDALGEEELTGMILNLREPYCTPCRLVLLEQHTMAEAARLCGRPPKTVEAQVYRAKKMLAQQILQNDRVSCERRSVHGTVDAKGCLSEEGLQALVGGQLDETQRLEAAEHLAYCDRCMDRYTALLTDDVLEQPPRSARGAVMGTIWIRLMQNTWGRAAVATVAAVLALTLWRAGTLEQILHTGQQLNTWLPQTTQQTEPELLGKPVNDKAPQPSTAPLGKPIEDKKQLTEKLSDALDALLHHSADTTEK